jgi:protease stability complex PrcB-like protein
MIRATTRPSAPHRRQGVLSSGRWSAVLALGLLIPLVACATGAVGDVAAEGGALTFSTVAKGVASGVLEPLQVAIRTRDEWVAFWARHTRAQVQPPSAPAVDFSREMVVGIFLGERATGGYEVEITKVERGGSELRIHYRSMSPEPRATVTQVRTEPYHVIKLRRDDSPLVFSREGSSR